MDKSMKKAAFGSSVKRFGKLTGHPNLDSSGLFAVRSQGCDPCLYSPRPLQKTCVTTKSKKKNKDPWRYKQELEEWAANLGYRNVKILEQRRWQQSLLGPAWTEIKKLTKYEPACKNLEFGRTPRNKPSKINYPCPGTYYKEKPYKVPFGPHSTRPSFEREDPCRFKDPNYKWSLAPNRYKIIDKNSIEVKSKKLVSRRGPYDLFTGKRDNSTIKNHFVPSSCAASTWPIALPGCFEELKKSHLGVINKTSRSQPCRGREALVEISMCLRRADEPGPAYLNLDKPKVFVQNKHGFNSSYDRPPGYQRVVVWPGVGRYNVRTLSCGIFGQGHRHVFLSKVPRTIGAILPQPMNSF